VGRYDRRFYAVVVFLGGQDAVGAAVIEGRQCVVCSVDKHVILRRLMLAMHIFKLGVLKDGVTALVQ